MTKNRGEGSRISSLYTSRMEKLGDGSGCGEGPLTGESGYEDTLEGEFDIYLLTGLPEPSQAVEIGECIEEDNGNLDEPPGLLYTFEDEIGWLREDGIAEQLEEDLDVRVMDSDGDDSGPSRREEDFNYLERELEGDISDTSARVFTNRTTCLLTGREADRRLGDAEVFGIRTEDELLPGLAKYLHLAKNSLL